MIINYDARYDKQIIELWNECLYVDQLNKKGFYSMVVLDENFDDNLFLLEVENNKVLGFVYGTKRLVPYENRGLESDRGWLVAMAVASDHQRQKIGTKLVKELEKRLKELEVKTITLAAYSPNYFFPGIDKKAYKKAVDFFNSLGYEMTSTCVSMYMNLNQYQTPAKYLKRYQELLKQGYVIRKFQLEDSYPLIKFLQSEFPGGWSKGIRKAILENRAKDQVLVCVDKDNQIVGFVQSAMDGNPQRFGPFGVKQSLRNLGIGSILFHQMMNLMCQNKVFYTYFLWTSPINSEKYGAWGMKIYREYQLARKVL